MTRLNYGIWIVFGTLVLFCFSYLGYHQLQNCDNLRNQKLIKKRISCKTSQLQQQAKRLNLAIEAHREEQQYLIKKNSEIRELISAMQNQALSSEELPVFYNHLVQNGNTLNLNISSMDSEALHFNKSTIVSLDLELEGTLMDLLAWIKSIDKGHYPMVIHHYDVIRSAELPQDTYQLSVALSVLAKQN